MALLEPYRLLTYKEKKILITKNMWLCGFLVGVPTAAHWYKMFYRKYFLIGRLCGFLLGRVPTAAHWYKMFYRKYFLIRTTVRISIGTSTDCCSSFSTFRSALCASGCVFVLVFEFAFVFVLVFVLTYYLYIFICM